MGDTQDIHLSSRKHRRDGEKLRRDRLNQNIGMLAQELPWLASSNRRPDKASVLKLTASYLKLHHGVKKRKLYPVLPDFLMTDLSELEKTMDGFLLIVTQSGIVIYLSEAICKLLGHSQVDIIGSPIKKILHEDDQNLFELQFGSRNSETYVTNSSEIEDGRYRKLNCSKKERCSFIVRMQNLLCTVNKKAQFKEIQINGYICTNKKSDRKKSKTSVVEESWFIGVCRGEPSNSLVELSPTNPEKYEWVSQHAMDGRIWFQDQRVALVVGKLPSEVTGTSVYELVFKEDLKVVAVSHMKIMTDEEIPSTVFRLQTQNARKQINYIQSRSVIVKDAWTKTHKYIVSLNQVLQDEEGELLLAEQEKRYQALVAATRSLTLQEDEPIYLSNSTSPVSIDSISHSDLSISPSESSVSPSESSISPSESSISHSESSVSNSAKEQSPIIEILNDNKSDMSISEIPAEYSDNSGLCASPCISGQCASQCICLLKSFSDSIPLANSDKVINDYSSGSWEGRDKKRKFEDDTGLDSVLLDTSSGENLDKDISSNKQSLPLLKNLLLGNFNDSVYNIPKNNSHVPHNVWLSSGHNVSAKGSTDFNLKVNKDNTFSCLNSNENRDYMTGSRNENSNYMLDLTNENKHIIDHSNKYRELSIDQSKENCHGIELSKKNDDLGIKWSDDIGECRTDLSYENKDGVDWLKQNDIHDLEWSNVDDDSMLHRSSENSGWSNGKYDKTVDRSDGNNARLDWSKQNDDLQLDWSKESSDLRSDLYQNASKFNNESQYFVYKESINNMCHRNVQQEVTDCIATCPDRSQSCSTPVQHGYTQYGLNCGQTVRRNLSPTTHIDPTTNLAIHSVDNKQKEFPQIQSPTITSICSPSNNTSNHGNNNDLASNQGANVHDKSNPEQNYSQTKLVEFQLHKQLQNKHNQLHRYLDSQEDELRMIDSIMSRHLDNKKCDHLLEKLSDLGTVLQEQRSALKDLKEETSNKFQEFLFS